MRYSFIDKHTTEFPVRTLCDVLAVSPSGFYAWRRRAESRRSREDRRLRAQIRAIHQESRQTYGSPRIHVELSERGARHSRKRIARLMREDGIQARQRRRFKATTDSSHNYPVAPNQLAQQFEVSAPDRVWLGDITYISTDEGWLYLAALMDLGSRRIVGWSMGERITQELTLNALDMAFEQRRPVAGLMHHSDRGSQYASRAYQKALRDRSVEVSMSRRGNCYDNAPMESFFHTLKVELLHGRKLASRAEARGLIFSYLEGFYNRKRRHSALGYLCPAQWEARHAA